LKSPRSKDISFLLRWLDPMQWGRWWVEELWVLLMKSLCPGARGCVEKWRSPPPPQLLTHSITMQTAVIRSYKYVHTLQRFDAGPKLENLNQRSWKEYNFVSVRPLILVYELWRHPPGGIPTLT
jgi:hypothetical protein